jgi:hypothetical protein
LNYNRSNYRSVLLRDLEENDDSQMQVNMNELVSYCLGSIEPDRQHWHPQLLEEEWNCLSNSSHVGPRHICCAHVNRPYEFCFSSVNKIITNKRGRLGAKTFEQLVCVKDWFDTEQHNQHAPVKASSFGEFMTNADGDSDSISENDLLYMNLNF